VHPEIYIYIYKYLLNILYVAKWYEYAYSFIHEKLFNFLLVPTLFAAGYPQIIYSLCEYRHTFIFDNIKSLTIYYKCAARS